MAYSFRKDANNKGLTKMMASVDIATSDIGKLAVETSNPGVALLTNTTQNSTQLAGYVIKGVVAAVPNNTSNGSTNPVYVRPVSLGEELEVDYSTALATNTNCFTDSTSIGYYFGPPVTAADGTAANGAVIDPSTCTREAGVCRFLKMTGYSTSRRKIYGVINEGNLIKRPAMRASIQTT